MSNESRSLPDDGSFEVRVAPPEDAEALSARLGKTYLRVKEGRRKEAWRQELEDRFSSGMGNMALAFRDAVAEGKSGRFHLDERHIVSVRPVDDLDANIGTLTVTQQSRLEALHEAFSIVANSKPVIVNDVKTGIKVYFSPVEVGEDWVRETLDF